MIDREAVSEAIVNLLDNAVKYSNETKFIKMVIANENNFVFIEVQDKGIGISEEDQKKVFDKFYRVSSGLVHTTKGTGLGLSLVKQIMDAHKGKIILKSKFGEGSSFKLLFPKNSQLNTERKMPKILVVDDEQNMRTGLKDNLEFEGYEVDTANDGEQGLKKIIDNSYNLVILDVMMPKKSGFDVCKEVRKAGITTPVILLTAKGDEIDKVVGLEIGADDYVTKPFSLRELLARVKAILRRGENLVMNESAREVKIGKLEINFDGYKATSKNKDVQMSHKEFEILHYLWKHRNSTVSRDDLLTEVWGYDENPSTRTVDNFILKLRQKVEVDSNHPQVILTVHGIGYKLVI